MSASIRMRNPLLALGLLLALGCSTDNAKSPGSSSPTAPAIPPAASVNVAVTASASAVEVEATDPTTITVRATRSDTGAPVANLTQATVTTTLGSLGSVGGPQTATLELVSGQSTVAFFPGPTVGTASIRAQVSTGVGLTSIQVREAGVPDTFFLASVDPNTGSPQGGETVTIHGGGFSDPIRVTFDGVPAIVQNATASTIRVTTPPCLDPAGTGCYAQGGIKAVTVSVTINLNEDGQATDSLASGFIYANNGGGGSTLQPTIFSVTPSSGPNEGGTEVTINGDGFESPASVEFGNGTTSIPYVTAQVLSVTRTRIVALSPPATAFGQGNLNQLVGIRVTNQASGRAGVASSAFRYGVSVVVTSIAPGQGSIYGGELVTLFGQGFDEPVAVAFGGFAQTPISVSGSEIVVRTTHPASCPSGGLEVTVVNIESGDGNSNGPSFSYLKPAIYSLSPSSGSQAGGTGLTVGGGNFGLPIIVDFTSKGTTRAGTVTNATTSTISVITPSMPDSTMNEEDCNDNADATIGKRFIATGATVKVTDPVSGCSDTFEGQFVFNPTNTSCRGD